MKVPIGSDEAHEGYVVSSLLSMGEENPNEAQLYGERSAIFDMEDATFEILLSKLKEEGATLVSHLVGRGDFVVPECPLRISTLCKYMFTGETRIATEAL
jgi:hypothetical protein